MSQCPAGPYVAVAPPDRLEAVFSGRKRYRLVIGASVNIPDPSRNLTYVESTARLVDGALKDAGYTESLGLLVGRDATKAKVIEALESIGSLDSTAQIVVYYVGHGRRSTTGGDLVLTVADQPVDSDSGLAVRTLLATALTPFDPRFRKIPRVVLVIESCFSGAASVFQPGFRSVFEDGRNTDFSRLAFLSSSSSTEESRPLPGDTVGAFGRFFADALNKDWACTDKAADGALTIQEIAARIQERLAVAKMTIGGLMQPDFLDRGHYSTLVYRPDRVANLEGFRAAVEGFYQVDVAVQGPNARTVVRVGEATVATCTISCGVLTDSPELVTAEVTYEMFNPFAQTDKPDTRTLRLQAPSGRGVLTRPISWRPTGGGSGSVQITVR